MTDEERRIITEFVQRIAGVAPAAPASAGPWSGSVPPSQPRPPLPPVDREADALIADLFNRYPEARYRITQTAFVQEYALTEAQNRIQELEWELENARREAQAAQSRGGLFGGIFGGGQQRPAPMPPRPQPLPPPGGVNPAMMQPGRSGPGFLATAAMTAAGVAGGMVLGNMLMNAFSGGGMAHAAGPGGGAFGQEAVPTSSPWTNPGAAAAERGLGAQDAWASEDQDASGGDAGYDEGGGYDEEI